MRFYTIILVMILLVFSNMSNAQMGVYIKAVTSLSGEITVDVLLINESDIDFHIYGANICTSPLLDRNLFQISYADKGETKALQFLGPVGEGGYDHVVLSSSKKITCKVRLDFNYLFPEKYGIEYSVKYKVVNPKYKDIQDIIELESKSVNFVR